MSSGVIARNSKGEDVDIELLSDKEIQQFITQKRRYQTADDDTWEVVAKLAKYIRDQPKRYILSVENLKRLDDGRTVQLLHGPKLMAEFADDLE